MPNRESFIHINFCLNIGFHFVQARSINVLATIANYCIIIGFQTSVPSSERKICIWGYGLVSYWFIGPVLFGIERI